MASPPHDIPSDSYQHEPAAQVTDPAGHQRASESDYNARTWQIERSLPKASLLAQMKRLGLA